MITLRLLRYWKIKQNTIKNQLKVFKLQQLLRGSIIVHFTVNTNRDISTEMENLIRDVSKSSLLYL